MKHVVIVGGGIAGLATAYRLRGHAEITLLEERPRFGGVIVTEHEAGFTVEGGPDSLLTTKPWALDLCKELGLSTDIVRPIANTVYVYTQGRLIPLPAGVFLTVPTRVWPFLVSPLFSMAGKLRMAGDLFLPRATPVDDESIGSFFRRRLGHEAVEKLADPLMAGIYMGAADEISLRATFPRFIDLEREHRSLILGLRRMRTPGGSVSPFVSLRHGIGQLVHALIAALKGVTLRSNTTVQRLEQMEDSRWRIHHAEGLLEADRVVLALPPPRAASLLRSAAPVLAQALDRIDTLSSTTVSLGYRNVRLPTGTGFVIPRQEGKQLVGCTWSSQKFPERAPADHVLIRCFFRHAPRDPISLAREEVRSILGLDKEPVLIKAFTWPEANPVYRVGHQALVHEIELLTPPGLVLTGCGFRGIGIPDAVCDASRTAENIIRTTGTPSNPPRAIP